MVYRQRANVEVYAATTTVLEVGPGDRNAFDRSYTSVHIQTYVRTDILYPLALPSYVI